MNDNLSDDSDAGDIQIAYDRFSNSPIAKADSDEEPPEKEELIKEIKSENKT